MNLKSHGMTSWGWFKWRLFRLRPRIIKWPKKTLRVIENDFLADNHWAVKTGWSEDVLIANHQTAQRLFRYFVQDRGYTTAEVKE